MNLSIILYVRCKRGGGEENRVLAIVIKLMIKNLYEVKCKGGEM